MHFLITAGGTREYIDPVRFISNSSTGKMGYALAAAALKAGHKVTLITAPSNQKVPKGAKIIHAVGADDMFKAVKANFPNADCLIMAAAVSDYKPARQSKTKIKKDTAELNIKLKPTTDILKWAGKNKADRFIVGFALEDKALKTRAHKKLIGKNLDMIVANTPSAIGADTSTVYIKTHGQPWIELKNKSKKTTAGRIIRLAVKGASSK